MLAMVKLMRRKLLAAGLIWFLAMFSVMANGPAQPNNCELPPPDSLWFPVVTPTSVTAEWSPVAGAVLYQVTIEDPVTSWGMTVTTPLTSYTFTGLTPGTDYNVTVCAMSCEEGSCTDGIESVVTTSYIIITDVIIQRCDKFDGVVDSRSPGDIDTYIFKDKDQYVIDVTSGSLRHHFIVEADLQRNSFKLQTYVNQWLDVPTVLNTQGQFVVETQPGAPGAPVTTVFYTIDNIAVIAPSQSRLGEFKITWNANVQLAQFSCPCNEEEGGGERSQLPRPEQTATTFTAAPVPFGDHLRISWPPSESGQAANLLLTDMAGRVVASQTSADGEVIWTTESLPSGIYLLHFDDGNLQQTRKLVKTR